MKMGSSHKKAQNSRKILLCLLCFFVAAFSPQQYGYRVVKSYPHDRNAFTQGLEFRDGFLYEGTGLVGRSSLRKVNLETGQVVQRFDVPQPFFGEGITVLNQRIVQLTWQSQTGFIYDKSSLRIIRGRASCKCGMKFRRCAGAATERGPIRWLSASPAEEESKEVPFIPSASRPSMRIRQGGTLCSRAMRPMQRVC